MKKIACLFIFAIIAMTNTAFAQDSLISSVNFSSASSTISSNTTYNYSFIANQPLPAGTSIYLFFYDENSIKTTTENGPNMLFGNYTSTSALNIDGFGHYIDSTVGFIYLNEEHPAGQYSFTVSDVVNPGIDIVLHPALSTTTEANNSSNYATLAEDNLNIGEIPKNTTDYVSTFNVISSDATASAYVTLNYSISTKGVLGIGDELYFMFSQNSGAVMDSGFDFSSASVSSDTALMTCDAPTNDNYAVLKCDLYDTLSVGAHELILTYVRNPDITGEYVPIISLQSSSDTSQYLSAAANLEITALTKPSKPKKNKFKVKNIKPRSALLKWASQANATYYRLQLDVYNNSLFSKKKTYSPTANKKQLTNKVLHKNTYRFKLRACNSAGCSKWSAYKKFQTK